MLVKLPYVAVSVDAVMVLHASEVRLPYVELIDEAVIVLQLKKPVIVAV